MRMIIITLAPARLQQSYRHEAFLWHDASDFTAGIVPFIRRPGGPRARHGCRGCAAHEVAAGRSRRAGGRGVRRHGGAWPKSSTDHSRLAAVPEHRVGAVSSRTGCRGADLAWTAPRGAC